MRHTLSSQGLIEKRYPSPIHGLGGPSERWAQQGFCPPLSGPVAFKAPRFGLNSQLTALFTKVAILASSVGVSSINAKAVGHT